MQHGGVGIKLREHDRAGANHGGALCVAALDVVTDEVVMNWF